MRDKISIYLCARLIGTAVLLVSAAFPVVAATVYPEEQAAGVQVSDAELDQMHGGFSWQGLNISLGADIRTYLDGKLALETTISWTPGGVHTDQLVFGSLTPAGGSSPPRVELPSPAPTRHATNAAAAVTSANPATTTSRQ